jgi:hypothetical protein
VLSGRAQEFGDITARMAGAADGTSGTLLVSGEPGVGKTALLREVTKHVSESAEVIWAACLPMSFSPATASCWGPRRTGGPRRVRRLCTRDLRRVARRAVS